VVYSFATNCNITKYYKYYTIRPKKKVILTFKKLTDFNFKQIYLC